MVPWYLMVPQFINLLFSKNGPKERYEDLKHLYNAFTIDIALVVGPLRVKCSQVCLDPHCLGGGLDPGTGHQQVLLLVNCCKPANACNFSLSWLWQQWYCQCLLQQHHGTPCPVGLIIRCTISATESTLAFMVRRKDGGCSLLILCRLLVVKLGEQILVATLKVAAFNQLKSYNCRNSSFNWKLTEIFQSRKKSGSGKVDFWVDFFGLSHFTIGYECELTAKKVKATGVFWVAVKSSQTWWVLKLDGLWVWLDWKVDQR